MIDNEIKEIILDKLNELYVKQFFKDKEKKNNTYVELKQCYLDLIKFFEKCL